MLFDIPRADCWAILNIHIATLSYLRLPLQLLLHVGDRPAPWHGRRNRRVFPIEQACDLFQRRALCLDEKEINSQTLDHQDHNVHKVEFPAQMLDADWIDVLIEDATQRREAETQRQALGADLVWQDLDSV
jgi:hypothetical protein